VVRRTIIAPLNIDRPQINLLLSDIALFTALPNVLLRYSGTRTGTFGEMFFSSSDLWGTFSRRMPSLCLITTTRSDSL
jgi:hypothetical protein